MGMAEGEDRAVVLIANKSVSEAAMDGLDDEVEGVRSEGPSISMGSRGSNSSPREISSSLSSGLLASFSVGIAAVISEGLAVTVGLTMVAGDSVSILGDRTIIGAAGCVGIRRRRFSLPSSNSSYICFRCARRCCAERWLAAFH
jgi:hypothetical protein